VVGLVADTTDTTGELVGDEVDGCELSAKQAEGSTTQATNCHPAAARAISSRTVAIAWASKRRYPGGSCGEPSPAATGLNPAGLIETTPPFDVAASAATTVAR
jgi:hypothetical protein